VRLLALDVGNSAFHAGLLADRRPQWRGRLPLGQADEFPGWLAGLFDRQGEEPPEHAVFCSVVPGQNGAVREALEGLGCRVAQVRGDSPVGLRNRYRDPSQLGADRLAAAVGAYRLAGGPVVVADAGTALTVDAVSGAGEFLGGAIWVGPQTGLAALRRSAAQLDFPVGKPALPGTDTASCLAAGAHWGTAGAVRELAARLREVIGTGAPLVLTGGAAGDLAAVLPFARLEPDLVLIGLAWCWEAMREANRRMSG